MSDTLTIYTVHFYDKTATRIIRTFTYTTRKGAFRAMARARAKGQISAWAGERTERDNPTTHH